MGNILFNSSTSDACYSDSSIEPLVLAAIDPVTLVTTAREPRLLFLALSSISLRTSRVTSQQTAARPLTPLIL